MSRTITPLWGKGLGRTFAPRNPTPDMFGGVSDAESNAFNADRCEAIKKYLDGERSDPSLTHIETTYGGELGGDHFDRSLAAGRGLIGAL